MMATTYISLHPTTGSRVELRRNDYGHDPRHVGKCVLELLCGETIVSLHSLTADDLRAFGDAVRDIEQQQHDKDESRGWPIPEVLALHERDKDVPF
jgi:hypothetical protein